MKLRCNTNSIRLRLRRSEIADLLRTGAVRESVAFGPKQLFAYTLRLADDVDALQAAQTADGITVSIPRSLGQRWGESEQVGLETEQTVGEGLSLHLLVEKDFPCYTRPGEDKADFFGELQSNSEKC
ncbi:MAG: hypothetical protein AAGJ82_06830 [Bacteroidota bacterium]